MFELYHRCFVQLERSEEDEASYSYTSHDLYLETLEADFKNLENEVSFTRSHMSVLVY